MSRLGHNLENSINVVQKLKQVPKAGLEFGDFIIATTCNSNYKIRKLENNLFEVSGGWFDRKGLSPTVLTIRGCTWGGSIIKVDIIAACGLCMEFGNNLITTPIKKIVIIKFQNMN